MVVVVGGVVLVDRAVGSAVVVVAVAVAVDGPLVLNLKRDEATISSWLLLLLLVVLLLLLLLLLVVLLLLLLINL